MKIYNEIILQWNKETQQYDTVYEDSFNYTGKILELQDYDPPQNTDSGYAEFWSNQNTEEYKQAVAERISELLISKFTQIENVVGQTGVENLQKTFRDGKLQSGRNKNDIMIIYEHDNDINMGSGNILDLIIIWADFIHPNQIGLNIAVTNQGDGGENVSPFYLELTAPGKAPFNINNLVGEMDISDVRLLTDSVAQFFNINKVKTNIDKSKLSDFLETEFSELIPITFTHILERFKKIKNELPFYRYRTDDFFQEYGVSELPISYRVEKFFEEFERIKEDIPAGRFGYDAVTVHAQGTSGYLFEDPSDIINSPRVPRILSITSKNGITETVYEERGGRGHRVTIFSRDSFANGNWNGIKKLDLRLDTYGGNTLPSDHPNYYSTYGGELEADRLADIIENNGRTGYLEGVPEVEDDDLEDDE